MFVRVKKEITSLVQWLLQNGVEVKNKWQLLPKRLKSQLLERYYGGKMGQQSIDTGQHIFLAAQIMYLSKHDVDCDDLYETHYHCSEIVFTNFTNVEQLIHSCFPFVPKILFILVSLFKNRLFENFFQCQNISHLTIFKNLVCVPSDFLQINATVHKKKKA